MPQSASFQSGQTSTVVALLYDSSFSTLRLPDLPLWPQALCSFRLCPSWILSALGLNSLWFSKERFLEEQQIRGNLNMDYIFFGVSISTSCCERSVVYLRFVSNTPPLFVCCTWLQFHVSSHIHFFWATFSLRVPGRAYSRHTYERRQVMGRQFIAGPYGSIYGFSTLLKGSSAVH